MGCVYTAQGLEWDWCGVILGDDLVRRDGVWVARRGQFRERPDREGYDTLVPGSADPRVALKSGAGLDERIRNAYHVLLTRASRAAVVYSVDPETQEFLRSMIPAVEIHGLRPSAEELPQEIRLGPRIAPPPRSARSGGSRG